MINTPLRFKLVKTADGGTTLVKNVTLDWALEWWEEHEVCPECEGSGRVEVEYVRGYGPNAGLAYRWDVCEECKGQGTIPVEDEEDE